MRVAGHFERALPMPTHIAGSQKEDAMAHFQGEGIRDASGREVVRFTTPSGVQTIVATCIPQEALVKMVRKLERQISRCQTRMAAAAEKVPIKG